MVQMVQLNLWLSTISDFQTILIRFSSFSAILSTFTGPGQGHFQITKLTERRARMSDDDWLTDRTAAGSQSTSNADGGTQKVVAPDLETKRGKYVWN